MTRPIRSRLTAFPRANKRGPDVTWLLGEPVRSVHVDEPFKEPHLAGRELATLL